LALKSGQTTFVPLWDRMEGAWLRTLLCTNLRWNLEVSFSLHGLGQLPVAECLEIQQSIHRFYSEPAKVNQPKNKPVNRSHPGIKPKYHSKGTILRTKTRYKSQEKNPLIYPEIEATDLTLGSNQGSNQGSNPGIKPGDHTLKSTQVSNSEIKHWDKKLNKFLSNDQVTARCFKRQND
jgi:hypothetical protein